MRHAEALGYRIKHLAFAKRSAQGIELRVHPTLVPRRVMLAHVNGVMNGVLIRGDAVGPMLLSGAGAGAEPTASSVVADLVDVVRALTVDPNNRVPHLAFRADSLSAAPILPMADIESAYYMRLAAVDQPGVLADITRILADLRISIEAIRQSEANAGEATVPIIILTHRVREAAMNAALERIARLPGIGANIVRLRMEEFA